MSTPELAAQIAENEIAKLLQGTGHQVSALPSQMDLGGYTRQGSGGPQASAPAPHTGSSWAYRASARPPQMGPGCYMQGHEGSWQDSGHPTSASPIPPWDQLEKMFGQFQEKFERFEQQLKDTGSTQDEIKKFAAMLTTQGTKIQTATSTAEEAWEEARKAQKDAANARREAASVRHDLLQLCLHNCTLMGPSQGALMGPSQGDLTGPSQGALALSNLPYDDGSCLEMNKLPSRPPRRKTSDPARSMQKTLMERFPAIKCSSNRQHPSQHGDSRQFNDDDDDYDIDMLPVLD